MQVNTGMVMYTVRITLGIGAAQDSSFHTLRWSDLAAYLDEADNYLSAVWLTVAMAYFHERRRSLAVSAGAAELAVSGFLSKTSHQPLSTADILPRTSNTSNNSPSAPSTSPTRPTARATTGWSRWSRPCWICTASWPRRSRTRRRPCSSARSTRPTGRIDRLVYELYGLTEEEIGIVEGLDHGGAK